MVSCKEQTSLLSPCVTLAVVTQEHDYQWQHIDALSDFFSVSGTAAVTQAGGLTDS